MDKAPRDCTQSPDDSKGACASGTIEVKSTIFRIVCTAHEPFLICANIFVVHVPHIHLAPTSARGLGTSAVHRGSELSRTALPRVFLL